MKVTAVGDVISAVVASLSAAVTYPVFDGPLVARPKRSAAQYICIGTDTAWIDEGGNPANSGTMQQQWKGLGQVSRTENLQIPCVAVGKSDSVADARALALAVVQDVFSHMGLKPTDAAFNALVSDITAIDSLNTSGGSIVSVNFTITADARLT